jgi:amino acid transporter
LIVLGLANMDTANLRWTETPGVSEISRASVFLLFVFAGIESALVPSGEVRDPGRTVPRAVLLALVLVTVVYALVQISAQGVLGSSLAGRASPLADVGTALMGPFGGALIGVGIVLSTFGYLCGMILAIPRALFAFGRDGVLPRGLAAVHPRFHTPWIAIIVQAILALVLALSSGFEPLVILANISVLLVYLGCAAAAWQLRRRGIRDASTDAGPLPGGRLAPPLAALVIIALLTSITPREWLVAGSCAIAGIVLFGISRMVRRE